ncbi:hypothetical protein C0580_00930 [Candidatus Parcubacteria bacterium]|nr:MAG: hypothetical protein C0580_00930 [Candidatus Parcubacteria bacterium]
MKTTIIVLVAIILLLVGYFAFNQKSPTYTNTENPETEQQVMSSDTVLDLSNQGLTQIPNSVFDKTSLEELNVSNNQLTGAIQAEIRHLQNLRVLNASDNQMTGVPAEIGQLEKLEILNLANNQLTGLPHELGNLKNLKTLYIFGNNYSEADLNIIKSNLDEDIVIIK